MSISNHLPSQDARQYLEDQVCEQHKLRTEAEGSALAPAIAAGDLLIAVMEKYRKKDYSGKTALFERTCGGSARTGRQYVQLAKHRELLEGENRHGHAGFGGHSIATALDLIRTHEGTHKPKSDTSISTGSAPSQATAARDDIGADSQSELARLEVLVEGQANEIRRLRELNGRLESRLEEDLDPKQLRAQIEKLGISRFRQEVLPPDWVSSLTRSLADSLTDTALSTATSEKLLGILEHKIPSTNKAARKCLRSLKEAVSQPPTIDGQCKVIRLH